MKKYVAMFSVYLAITLLLSSCSSIYSELKEVTKANYTEVDLNSEYFTQGIVSSKGNIFAGYYYEGFWIYAEKQNYSYQFKRRDGEILTLEDSICRFVKVNAETGTVSSLCLDPVCNHSIDSDCLMIAPKGHIAILQDIVGDWLMFTYGYGDSILGVENKSYVYNLKTGEAIRIFEQNMTESVMVKWDSRCIFENSIFGVKNTLDYSNTNFDPTSNIPLYEYKPETVSILGEYSFDKKSTKELFEIPAGYALIAVTNKRFFFMSPENEVYSCNRSGENMKKEDVLDFSPDYLCGTYAYVSNSSNNIEIYDLSTNKKKTLNNNLRSTYSIVTDVGILADDLSTLEEANNLNSRFNEFMESHSELEPYDAMLLFEQEIKKIKYKGATQIWKRDLSGDNPKLIFEQEHCVAQIVYANKEYLYGFIYYGDPHHDFIELPYENEGRSYINIKSGEITPVPYLELIIPEIIEAEDSE